MSEQTINANNNGMAMLNSEKQIKASRYTQELKQVKQHLELLREDTLKKLIKSNEDREMHILLGTLRSYDKLLTLLA